MSNDGSHLDSFFKALAALTLLVAGCAVGPDYHPPDLQVPDRWHASAGKGLKEGAADLSQWWQHFNDPQLSELIDQSMEGNLNLRLAVLRIRQARALRGVAAGELLPVLGAQGSYTRSRPSANGVMAAPQAAGKADMFASTVARGIAGNALGTGLASVAPGASGITNSIANGLIGMLPNPTGLPDADELDLHSVGFDASWEIDLFGGIRRNIESADADWAATVEDYRGILVSLLAEVATTYIDIRSLQSQIETTRQNIKLQQATVSLTRVRLDSELVSELDVRQAETNLATTESELPLLETGLAVAIYRMGVLIGREPTALYDELSAARPIPPPPAETLVGVPVDILRRRPDIRAAERRLAAETARIGVAAAELYPRLTLSGTFGFEATRFANLLDGRSISYGFGPAVRWNVFDGLRNLNRIAAQQAAAQQACVAYEQALLTALQDVESSAVAYAREQVRQEALIRATRAGEQAAQLAETRYEDGLTDFQNVLIAQRSLVNLQNALAQSRGQVAVNLVALYKALGGGWSSDVVPQREYLDDPDGVLAHPVEFYVSGGRGDLPWSGASNGAAEAGAATGPAE